MMAKILREDGYPVDVIGGYRGSADLVSALESGELDAIANNEAIFVRRPDMAAKCNRVMQLLPSALPIPLARDNLSDGTRRLLVLSGSGSATGMPLVMPPGTTAPLLALVRSAFQRMMRDPEAILEAERIGEPAGPPLTGEQIRQRLSKAIEAASPEIVARFRDLAAK